MITWAAIGSDGTREVVWATDTDLRAAINEAIEAGAQDQTLRAVEVDDATAVRIARGVIDCKRLGLDGAW
jgi:hypothetical protein